FQEPLQRRGAPICYFTLTKTQNIWSISNNALVPDTGQFQSCYPIEILRGHVEGETADITGRGKPGARLSKRLGNDFSINRSAKSPFEFLDHLLKQPQPQARLDEGIQILSYFSADAIAKLMELVYK